MYFIQVRQKRPSLTSPPSQRSRRRPSGRLSVTSCESDDSGVSSNRGDNSPTEAQPFTIALHSPSSNGFLQLVPDPSEGSYIGYFKPITVDSKTEPTKPTKPRPSSSSGTQTNRKRFQARNGNHVSPKLRSKRRKTAQQEKTLRVNAMSVIDRSSKTDNTSDLKKVTRPSRLSKQTRSCVNGPKGNARTSTTLRKSRSSVAKILLKRIQHHNKSPERLADGVDPKARSCRNLSLRSSLITYSPPPRSEERRVGKECRSRWSPDP